MLSARYDNQRGAVACPPARRTAVRWGTAVAKVMVTMSDKGPGDKDVRGDGTGWILSTGAAGMDITPGKVRYLGAYRADDMHVPCHRRTRCKWLYCARAIRSCPLTANSWLSGMHKCRDMEVASLQEQATRSTLSPGTAPRAPALLKMRANPRGNCARAERGPGVCKMLDQISRARGSQVMIETRMR